MLVLRLLVALASLAACVPVGLTTGDTMLDSSNSLGLHEIALSHVMLPSHHPMVRRRKTTRYRRNQGNSSLLSSITIGGVALIANVTLGNEQTFPFIVDTGSSDTWIAGSDFVCEDMNSVEIDQAACEFGATYTPSSCFVPLLDLSLAITYGDEEFVSGGLGTEAVTAGDIMVVNQTIAVVDLAFWYLGDNYTSGLLGLAYPSITSGRRNSTDAGGSEETTGYSYDPFFTSMWKQNLTAPIFSFAVDRPSGDFTEAGTLAFGGLPNVDFLAPMVTTPIRANLDTNSTQGNSANPPDPSIYSITIDGLVYRPVQSEPINCNLSMTGCNFGASLIQTMPNAIAFLDTGTSGIILPYDQANAINALFSPPLNPDFSVECSATAPTVGFQVEGQTFYMGQQDLIHVDPDGTCWSNIYGNEGPIVLGLQFFWNKVVVFDVGSGVIQIAAREIS